MRRGTFQQLVDVLSSPKYGKYVHSGIEGLHVIIDHPDGYGTTLLRPEESLSWSPEHKQLIVSPKDIVAPIVKYLTTDDAVTTKDHVELHIRAVECAQAIEDMLRSLATPNASSLAVVNDHQGVSLLVTGVRELSARAWLKTVIADLGVAGWWNESLGGMKLPVLPTTANLAMAIIRPVAKAAHKSARELAFSLAQCATGDEMLYVLLEVAKLQRDIPLRSSDVDGVLNMIRASLLQILGQHATAREGLTGQHQRDSIDRVVAKQLEETTTSMLEHLDVIVRSTERHLPQFGPLVEMESHHNTDPLEDYREEQLTFDRILENAVVWTEYILGGKGYVSAVTCKDGLTLHGAAVDGIYTYKNQLVQVANTNVRDPLIAFLDRQYSSGDPTLDNGERGKLFQVRTAMHILLHEHIHALGSSQTAFRDADWPRMFPGSRVLREGITELASHVFLDDFLRASGIAALDPRILTCEESSVYLGETTAISIIVTEAAIRSGISPSELLGELAVAGDAERPCALLVERFLVGIPSQDGSHRIVQRHAVRHAIEESLSVLDQTCARTIHPAQLTEAGRVAGWQAIANIDRACQPIAHQKTSLPNTKEAPQHSLL